MIKEVTHEQLFNLGNYENLRLSATAIPEDGDVAAAWAEAKAAVQDQHTAFINERAEAARKAQEEYEAERARLRAEREAERARQQAEWEAEQAQLASEIDEEEEEDTGPLDDSSDPTF